MSESWSQTRIADEPYAKWWNRTIALYKGDELIDIGTVQEVAERRGVLKRTIYFMSQPAYVKRAKNGKKPRIVAYTVSEDDDAE